MAVLAGQQADALVLWGAAAPADWGGHGGAGRGGGRHRRGGGRWRREEARRRIVGFVSGAGGCLEGEGERGLLGRGGPVDVLGALRGRVEEGRVNVLAVEVVFVEGGGRVAPLHGRGERDGRLGRGRRGREGGGDGYVMVSFMRLYESLAWEEVGVARRGRVVDASGTKQGTKAEALQGGRCSSGSASRGRERQRGRRCMQDARLRHTVLAILDVGQVLQSRAVEGSERLAGGEVTGRHGAAAANGSPVRSLLLCMRGGHDAGDRRPDAWPRFCGPLRAFRLARACLAACRAVWTVNRRLRTTEESKAPGVILLDRTRRAEGWR
ncbi:hypothetical protein BDY21DRAFT_349990 [Lineolata rhizophorae]|uniref:Uncharacterized protein n=1 Tax=Lineolata rhizophorae TaxID=578093 RepID=A0A6A6NWM5_9PEZI|nr:hypothetical protein BDY21DRAFT_349990 [Lineolata rhizophorae]